MTVSTVASSIDHAIFYIFRDFESSGLILIKRPEMILFVKISLASGRLIFLEFPVAVF